MSLSESPGRPRSLSEWIEYIQTIHARTIELGLERAASVWARFKPENMPLVIAVAGTNGKGSSLSMLESVYRGAGYSTGAFTSPHLVRFNERICLNNVPVSDARLLASFEKIERIRAEVRLTFFEFNTLLALDIFCEASLDVILLEVGLGGRLDAVNIVDNDLALITAISLDHCAWLGDNREDIGREKAGIIKPGAYTVIADPRAPASVIDFARLQGANTLRARDDFWVENIDDDGACFKSHADELNVFNQLRFDSGLDHENNNTAGVIAAIGLLSQQLPITVQQLSAGLEQQFLPARLQLIDHRPRILLDVSHNEDSVLAMIDYIDKLNIQGEIHAVFGALIDKTYDQAYEQLKKRVASWYLCTIAGERGQSAQLLAEKLFFPVSNGLNSTELFDSALEAYNQARLDAHKNDLIVIFGSFHVVGAIIEHLDI